MEAVTIKRRLKFRVARTTSKKRDPESEACCRGSLAGIKYSRVPVFACTRKGQKHTTQRKRSSLHLPHCQPAWCLAYTRLLRVNVDSSGSRRVAFFSSGTEGECLGPDNGLSWVCCRLDCQYWRQLGKRVCACGRGVI